VEYGDQSVLSYPQSEELRSESFLPHDVIAPGKLPQEEVVKTQVGLEVSPLQLVVVEVKVDY